MRVIKYLVLIVVVSAVFSSVSAEMYEDTAVYAYSSRSDSEVGFGVRNGGFSYQWVRLSVLSLNNANYSLLVDDEFVLDGRIVVNESFVVNATFKFESKGWHNFTVCVGDDVYRFRVKVLMRSYEQYYEEEVFGVKVLMYAESEVYRIWFTSLVGVSAAAGLAFVVRLDRIKREKRRLL